MADALTSALHPLVTRRRFVQGIAAGAVVGLAAPLRAAAPSRGGRMEPAILTGDRFDLTVEAVPVNVTGYARTAIGINGSVPGPVLRFREGDTVTIRVTNRLREDTSIHWHGLLLPPEMDGVPGLSFRGIAPGETFVYRYPVKQSGTFWYHSHSGLQEQLGHYGALLLEPRTPAPYSYDREHVVVLSDWTDEDPMTVVSNLKQESDYYNFQKQTVVDLAAEAKQSGLAATLKGRLMWGAMRMDPTDLMDVTGATYTFLMNGQAPAANWTGLFRPGEKVRLRFINASAMSTFDVRIPGLPLRIVQADGTDVEPVEIEEFRIGVAETYDAIVEPSEERAYTIFAQAQDRSGYARGTLAPRLGMSAAIPPLDSRPLRPMADMGMNHGSMEHGSMEHGGMQPQGMKNGGMDHSGMQHGGMKDPEPITMSHREVPTHGTMQHGEPESQGTASADPAIRKALLRNPMVDNVVESPTSRLQEAGVGLADNGRRVLTYAMLRSLRSSTPEEPVDRIVEFHLTGNMHRFSWGFDGKKFSEAEVVRVGLGERVRFVLINDTMMEHPIHLHGFLFELENEHAGRLPLKHTVNVKPAERLSFLYTAHTAGHWAFHCHLLYHMEVGMFRTVVVA